MGPAAGKKSRSGSSGKPHTSQARGGKPRPAQHSGSRVPKSEWLKIVGALQDELDRTNAKLVLATAFVDSPPRPPLFVKLEPASPLAKGTYDAELDHLRSALSTSDKDRLELIGQLDACQQELSSSKAKADYLNTRLQQTLLDLEWAVGLKRDKMPPPTVLREKVRPSEDLA